MHCYKWRKDKSKVQQASKGKQKEGLIKGVNTQTIWGIPNPNFYNEAR